MKTHGIATLHSGTDKTLPVAVEDSSATSWPPRAALLCAAVTAAIICADLLVPRVNLAILFVVPLVIVLRASRDLGTRVRVALVLGVLTLVDYLFKSWWTPGDLHFGHPGWLWNAWLFNRALVVMTMAMLTVLSAATQRQTERMEALRRLREANPEDAEEYENALMPLEQWFWAAVCVMLTLGVFILDWMTPPRWNLPILYVLPVVVSALGSGRYLMLAMVPVALLGNIAGFYVGPPAVNPALLDNYVINHMVAAVGVVVVAMVVHLLLETRERQRAGGGWSGTQT
jgi:hypothetical protein